MAENADGEVRIATTLDTQDLQKQLDQLKGKLDKTGKDIEKKGGVFNKVGDFIKSGGLKAAVGGTAAAIAIKKTVDALDDCAEAYRVQANAEKALEIAARNNPYLNDENVYNLRQFASALQGMSEVGDEVSLQVMSQLAATGRTEQEIMRIMQAAADMAAATGQDIGSVAQQLNATFTGNAGALARQIGEVKNLTQAELEAGKAVEIIASKYKGSAAELADVEVQLSNAWGDFKENIGRGWQQVTEPVKSFFLGVLNDINEITSKTNALEDAEGARANGTNTALQIKLLLDNAREQLSILQKEHAEAKLLVNDSEALRKKTAEMHGYYSKGEAERRYNSLTQQISSQAEKVRQLSIEYGKLSEAEKKAAEEEAALLAEQEKANAQVAKDAEAVDVINNNAEALAKRIEQMRIQSEVTGEAIDEQELYNTMLQSYIDLVTTSEQVTEKNSAAKARLAQLEQQREKAQQYREELEKSAEAEKAERDAAEDAARKKQETLEAVMSLLGRERDARLQLIDDIQAFNDLEVLSEKEKAEAINKIRDELAQEEENHKKDEKEKQNAELIATVKQYTDYARQVEDIFKSLSDLRLQLIEAESTQEQAELEKRYMDGEVTEEEYYEKQKEIKRKAAQDSYKIKMWEWHASMLAAAASIAEGVTKALTLAPPMSFINAGLVSAMGALQIASLSANKPIPPSFYTGGVVGGMHGASMGGDNTYIHARAGEMILNANQQRSLWDMINGQHGRGGYSLTVNNTQSGRVDTDISQDTNGGLIVEIIDKHINKGFADGTFDGGMAAMQNRMQGVTIL